MSQEHRKLKKERQAQSILEYSLLLGIVVSVAVAMTPMVRRATQGMLKLTADQVGVQVNSEQLGGRYGYLEEQTVYTNMDQRTRVQEYLGIKEYSYNGSYIETDSSSSADLGFQEQAVK